MSTDAGGVGAELVEMAAEEVDVDVEGEVTIDLTTPPSRGRQLEKIGEPPSLINAGLKAVVLPVRMLSMF